MKIAKNELEKILSTPRSKRKAKTLQVVVPASCSPYTLEEREFALTFPSMYREIMADRAKAELRLRSRN